MLDHHQHASEAPFKWRFAGGLVMTRLYWHFDPPYLQRLKNPKKKKKNVVKFGPPLQNSLDPRMVHVYYNTVRVAGS